MPKRTMGGSADAKADAKAYEASKPRVKLDMEKSVTPLPRHLPPMPQPVVNDNDDGEEVAPMASLLEQVVAPQPQSGACLPWGRELDNGLHDKRVRPRIGMVGYRCPFCKKLMKGSLTSAIRHALGTSHAYLKNGYAFRVAHAAYAEYLIRL
ncbi:hypothetical protein ZWY2020_037733 [Hordeum vulgare]|nr:hypothetical protein ZWY2020_037733 [Hordeum vulgare]